MLTKQQLEEIRERSEKATKGSISIQYIPDWYGRPIGLELLFREGPQRNILGALVKEADAQFIVGAFKDVPTLLAEVERLKNLAKDAYSEGFHDSCKGYQEDFAWMHSWTRDILLSQEATDDA